MAIIIKPESVAKERPSDFLEKIISGLDSTNEVDLIGLGDAVFLACSSVKQAIDLANIGISEIAVDYWDHPFLGRYEGIFFVLSKQKGTDQEAAVQEKDAGMDLSIAPVGQVIMVPKLESPNRIVIMALHKLRMHDRIKIIGAGGAINTAVSVALKLVKGNVAKDPIGIEAIVLSTVMGKGTDSKPTTGINIYLAKGTSTIYTEHHQQLLAMLSSGKPT